MSGKLIAFTGIDSSGKTSSIRSINVRLGQQNITTAIFENHTPFSAYWNVYKRIAKECVAREEPLPYALDRFMHAFELCLNCEEILPQLMREYRVVLSDRYILDKMIYGRLRGEQHIAERALETINFKPDLTLFLDVSVKTALKRIAYVGGPEDWKEEPQMLYRAYEAYKEVIPNLDGRVVTICAEQPLVKVVEDCIKEIFRVI